ncbi:MAG TPA: Hsp20/alpha crystallin family protein [Ktedonobacteraceae bacterium]|nr:Hsp20/alpha crystallin family protein [Ktedonobacteraceae bacterium]
MLQRFETFDSLMPLREAVNRLFEESFVGPRFEIVGGKSFPINVYETPDRKQLLIEAALPGIKPEHIHVQIEGDVLTIRAEYNTKEQTTEKGTLIRREITRGEMYRALTLPISVDVEHIEATYEQGILTLHMPKAQAVLPKQVPVNVKELANV